jgi:hypothetical protein
MLNIALVGLAVVVPVPRTANNPLTVVRPRIEVWSNHGDAVYTRSQGVRVYFRADQDGFVTLFRVDTDGRVRVLFPRDPWEDNFVRGGREYEALGNSSRDAFYVDDYPGVGYLFAVVAADPFDYSAIESGNHWDYRTIADGRVRGDPYVALTDLAERIVPENYADWDYDIAPYYVNQHYDYPRFLCYDCHAYASYTYWDPYWRSCVRFRIVVYDDPYYYPYRYYGGRRVVFVRPFRPEPRFVFKDRDGSGRDQFVSRQPQRPVNDDTRRSPGTRRDPTATGTTGLVPAPRDRDRETADRGSIWTQRRDATQNNRPDQTGNDDSRRRRVDDPNRGGDTQRGGNDSQVDRGRRIPDDADRGRAGESNRGRGQEKERGWERPPVIRSEPRGEPRRSEPRDVQRAEPRRSEPRAEPRQSRPESRAEPRAQPRAEPRRESPPSSRAEPRRSEPKQQKPSQPELRRRKPD